jgi:hypothetical protein
MAEEAEQDRLVASQTGGRGKGDLTRDAGTAPRRVLNFLTRRLRKGPRHSSGCADADQDERRPIHSCPGEIDELSRSFEIGDGGGDLRNVAEGQTGVDRFRDASGTNGRREMVGHNRLRAVARSSLGERLQIRPIRPEFEIDVRKGMGGNLLKAGTSGRRPLGRTALTRRAQRRNRMRTQRMREASNCRGLQTTNVVESELDEIRAVP